MATLRCPVCDRTVEADAKHPATRCTITSHRVIRRRHFSSSRIAPICCQCSGTDEHRHYVTGQDGRLEARLHVIGANGIVGRCEGCGIYVRLPNARHRTVFACSTACRMKRYQHSVERSVTACERCGQSFTARRGAHYCSPACRQSAYRNRHRQGHDGRL